MWRACLLRRRSSLCAKDWNPLLAAALMWMDRFCDLELFHRLLLASGITDFRDPLNRNIVYVVDSKTKNRQLAEPGSSGCSEAGERGPLHLPASF